MRKYKINSILKKALIVVTFLAITLSGLCVLTYMEFNAKPTEIKTGFSNKKILKMLEEKYELRIPSDAIFISGYYDNELQDAAVHITFKIQEEELNYLFINNWETYMSFDKDKYSSDFKYQKQMYTHLSCSYPIDGFLTIDFTGRYPGNPIK